MHLCSRNTYVRCYALITRDPILTGLIHATTLEYQPFVPAQYRSACTQMYKQLGNTPPPCRPLEPSSSSSSGRHWFWMISVRPVVTYKLGRKPILTTQHAHGELDYNVSVTTPVVFLIPLWFLVRREPKALTKKIVWRTRPGVALEYFCKVCRRVLPGIFYAVPVEVCNARAVVCTSIPVDQAHLGAMLLEPLAYLIEQGSVVVVRSLCFLSPDGFVGGTV